MLIDAHCHFFTNSILADRLKKDAKSLLRLSKKLTGEPSHPALRGAACFLTTGIENTPEEMYEYMKGGYGCDFIAVPLMLDLTYAFLSPEQKSRNDSTIIKALDSMKASSLPVKHLENLEKRIDTFERSVLGIDVFQNSYQKQINDLTAIKEKMPDRVFPFFSVDPRRYDEFEGGILSEIKKYVGKNKPFLGVKLYSSLGYSPTHPVLFDNSKGQSVYGYCERHNIPITVHSSIEGFSHFLDKTRIIGDVYYPEAGKCVPAESLYESGIVKYTNNIPSINFEEITRERLILLNHPIIWRKVLEKYPNLKIDLAHFGGVIQSYKYAVNDKSSFWTEYIIDMLNDFPNVYTDLSCFYEQDNNPDYMKVIYKNLYKKLSKKARQKVMFGSDYYMLALYNTTPKDYITSFREAFKNDFYKISEENPSKFLDIKVY
mgnify:CR=1 FL=1